MAQKIEIARARAEAMFRKADPGQAGSTLQTGRDSADRMQQEKIARLRALRLAKESSLQPAPLSDLKHET